MLHVRTNGYGIGDSLHVAGAVHTYFRRTQEKAIVVAGYGELFENHPGVAEFHDYYDILVYKNKSVEGPLIDFLDLDDMTILTDQNIVQFMCRKIGIEPLPDTRPYINLLPQEFNQFEIPTTEEIGVTIHVETGMWSRNKTWGRANFEEVAKRIRGMGVRVTQVGGPSEYVLQNADANCLGVPLRKTACLISRAKCHISGVTGTLHMAAAVDTSAFALIGGREKASAVCHGSTIPFENFPSMGCAPCWKVPDCPYGVTNEAGEFLKPCLEAITPDTVYVKLQEFLERQGQ